MWSGFSGKVEDLVKVYPRLVNHAPRRPLPPTLAGGCHRRQGVGRGRDACRGGPTPRCPRVSRRPLLAVGFGRRAIRRAPSADARRCKNVIHSEITCSAANPSDSS